MGLLIVCLLGLWRHGVPVRAPGRYIPELVILQPGSIFGPYVSTHADACRRVPTLADAC